MQLKLILIASYKNYKNYKSNMSNIFKMSNDTIDTINKIRKEAQTMSETYDLDITYIINIFIIGQGETPIEITIKCDRVWTLSILMEIIEGVFNASMDVMKFMIRVNDSWTLLDHSKMLNEYDAILHQTNYTIYLSNVQ